MFSAGTVTFSSGCRAGDEATLELTRGVQLALELAELPDSFRWAPKLRLLFVQEPWAQQRALDRRQSTLFVGSPGFEGVRRLHRRDRSELTGLSAARPTVAPFARKDLQR